MSSADKHLKRLIEVDLPIRRISEQARREKSIRHGHISTLHVWWARRPLAACRAVICAALWPDPADELCPESFRAVAREKMRTWATEHLDLCSEASWKAFVAISKNPQLLEDAVALRQALLDFVADFANWNSSTSQDFLVTSRALTDAAHEALGGVPGTHPLVVDPFAGGGAIPLEALRVGADAFASDLNPIPVLLNKVILEFVPQFGDGLADAVERWGEWVEKEATKALAPLYPADKDGSTPVAYLWARTMRCEGPGCGAELPLVGQTWLSTKDGRRRALGLVGHPRAKTLEISVLNSPKAADVMATISKKGSVTCPLCGYTTPAKRLRESLSKENGGSDQARLLAVVSTHPARRGKEYRTPRAQDLEAVKAARVRLRRLEHETLNGLPAIPHEEVPPEGALGFRIQKYGVRRWRDLYTSRQLVTLATFCRIVGSPALRSAMGTSGLSATQQDAVLSCLGLAVGRVNDLSSTLCRWLPSLEAVAASNGAQNKMPMILDFVEANPLGGSGGDWSGQVDWIVRVLRNLASAGMRTGAVAQSPAQHACLPEDSVAALVTDPPYYAAFGYSDLSEFFYPWLRRSVPPAVLGYELDHVPKEEEAISIGKTLTDGRGEKNDATYLTCMKAAFEACRRTVRGDGIGVVVFANKTTAGWEAILEALVGAGWMVSASWPIDTERPNRQRAIGSAALQSSVHLVCRPRGSTDAVDEVGDWRVVLRQLPTRLHEWMPRLSAEGVVGADAIFACLGPALEVFSRYSRVEKANGEAVALKEYLEQVWAAVAREALSLIFEDADATGLEEDARLTAMWLWTLSAGRDVGTAGGEEDGGEGLDEDDEGPGKVTQGSGFSLEFDAARKIAQGLGAHLDALRHLVEVKGDEARLLSVSERTRFLFGKESVDAVPARRPKKVVQLTMFEELVEAEKEAGWGDVGLPPVGDTTLSRVHQAMILFATGRAEAVKRFLVENGVGRDARFWKLAQSLSALYPPGSEEKRWVDGVLTRKKGLGFG